MGKGSKSSGRGQAGNSCGFKLEVLGHRQSNREHENSGIQRIPESVDPSLERSGGGQSWQQGVGWNPWRDSSSQPDMNICLLWLRGISSCLFYFFNKEKTLQQLMSGGGVGLFYSS